jgi:Skp family chaperone for outer membrane proteins
MKHTYLVRNLAILAGCLVFAATFAVPAPAADVKIAKISLASVYKNSVRIKQFSDELQQLQSSSQAKETSLAGEIKKLREQLQAGKATMPNEQKDKIESELKEKFEALENERMTLQYNMSLKQQSLRNVVEPQVKEIVAKIAKAEGYTMVIAEQLVMYVAPDVPDITDKVTKALDEMPPAEKQALPEK